MKPGIRYRFSEGGKTTDAKPEHAEHMQVAHTLLNEVIQHATIFGLEQFRRTINLSDKTSITASVNVGFSEVRIDTPPPPPPPPKELPKESAQQDEPPPEEGGEEEEEEEKTGDYLWIGIRPVQAIGTEDGGARCVGGLLIEPDGVHTFLGEYSYYEHRNYNLASKPLSDPDSFDYVWWSQYQAFEPWNYSKKRPSGYEPLVTFYKPSAGGYGGALRFSPGGVIGYCIAENGNTNNSGVFGEPFPPLSVTTSLMPYDPTIPVVDEQYPAGQLRSPPNASQLDTSWGDPHWHNVFVLDPNPGDGIQGHALRQQDRYAYAVVKKTIGDLYGNTIKVKKGKYILKVSLQGFCMADNSTPVELEIEVRVGKDVKKTKKKTTWGPKKTLPTEHETTEIIQGKVFKTNITISRWAYEARPCMPYGGGDTGPFGPNDMLTGSPNPHAQNWWQGGIEIDITTRSVKEHAYLLPSADIGLGSMFVQGAWDEGYWRCPIPAWYPMMVSSFFPGTVFIGDTLHEQAYRFARTLFFNNWYLGEQGYNWQTIDWSQYNIAPLTAQVLAYAATNNTSDLNWTKLIVSGHPSDLGTFGNPSVVILEMSPTSQAEWSDIILVKKEIYNGIYHRMRIAF